MSSQFRQRWAWKMYRCLALEITAACVSSATVIERRCLPDSGTCVDEVRNKMPRALMQRSSIMAELSRKEMVETVEQEEAPAGGASVFFVLDSNQDGQVDMHEIEIFADMQGMEKKEAMQEFFNMDADHDGSLSKAELVEAMGADPLQAVAATAPAATATSSSEVLPRAAAPSTVPVDRVRATAPQHSSPEVRSDGDPRAQNGINGQIGRASALSEPPAIPVAVAPKMALPPPPPPAQHVGGEVPNLGTPVPKMTADALPQKDAHREAPTGDDDIAAKLSAAISGLGAVPRTSAVQSLQSTPRIQVPAGSGTTMLPLETARAQMPTVAPRSSVAQGEPSALQKIAPSNGQMQTVEPVRANLAAQTAHVAPPASTPNAVFTTTMAPDAALPISVTAAEVAQPGLDVKSQSLDEIAKKLRDEAEEAAKRAAKLKEEAAARVEAEAAGKTHDVAAAVVNGSSDEKTIASSLNAGADSNVMKDVNSSMGTDTNIGPNNGSTQTTDTTGTMANGTDINKGKDTSSTPTKTEITMTVAEQLSIETPYGANGVAVLLGLVRQLESEAHDMDIKAAQLLAEATELARSTRARAEEAAMEAAQQKAHELMVALADVETEATKVEAEMARLGAKAGAEGRHGSDCAKVADRALKDVTHSNGNPAIVDADSSTGDRQAFESEIQKTFQSSDGHAELP